jgi:predicted DNA-binding transcriptional regulator AlpA
LGPIANLCFGLLKRNETAAMGKPKMLELERTGGQANGAGPTALDERYLPTRRVRRRYGISETTLTRWLRDKGFPTPTRLSGRRYWRLSEVVQWEAEQEALAAAEDEI